LRRGVKVGEGFGVVLRGVGGGGCDCGARVVHKRGGGEGWCEEGGLQASSGARYKEAAIQMGSQIDTCDSSHQLEMGVKQNSKEIAGVQITSTSAEQRK